MGLGGTKVEGDVKVIIRGGGQPTKGWEHFLLGQLTPQGTK